MKTFETEKHNIPEGATHYCNESDDMYFSWFKGVDTEEFEVMSIDTRGEWVSEAQYRYEDDGITIIPQTNIKTPKERDLLDNTPLDQPTLSTSGILNSDQVNELIEELSDNDKVKWKNGDECSYQGENWNFVSILSEDFHGTAVVFNTDTEELKQVPIISLSKPETPAQKEERKRLETVKDMFSYWSEDEGDFVAGDADDRWVVSLLFSLYDAGYKKKEDK